MIAATSFDTEPTSYPARLSTYQIEPRSPPRSTLKVQKFIQPLGVARYTGRFTATQAATVVPNVTKNGRHRPDRRQSTANGTNSSTGYSFAAIPSPSQTPVHTGERRAQASIASAVRAITRPSQLIRADVQIAGATAIISASHGRWNCRCVQTTNANSANSSTMLMPKNRPAA